MEACSSVVDIRTKGSEADKKTPEDDNDLPALDAEACILLFSENTQPTPSNNTVDR